MIVIGFLLRPTGAAIAPQTAPSAKKVLAFDFAFIDFIRSYYYE